MQRICGSLARNGYRVELVGRELKNSRLLEEQSFSQKRLPCYFNKGKLFYAEFNLRLFFYLLFQKSQAICAIDLDTIVAVYFGGKIKGAKLVYDAHEYFPEVPEVIGRPFTQKVWQLVEQIFVQKYDAIYTVTKSIADVFEKLYKVRVEVIRNVTENREQRTEIREQKTDKRQHTTNNSQLTTDTCQLSTVNSLTPFLLYQGALNKGRGLESLIEAMQEVDINCVIAGEGDLSKELREQVEKLNLQHKVFFTGKLSPLLLKELTANAFIGVNLLENKGLSYYYSLANKFFDYIHAKVPQICINFPEYSRINRDYKVAILIDNLEGNTISQAIKRLSEDTDLYTQLKLNCNSAAAELNWENEEKKLLAIYDKLF